MPLTNFPFYSWQNIYIFTSQLNSFYFELLHFFFLKKPNQEDAILCKNLTESQILCFINTVHKSPAADIQILQNCQPGSEPF